MSRRFLIIMAVALVTGITAISIYRNLSYNSIVTAAANATSELVIGPQNAALTIVEFVDYRCPYCIALNRTLTEATRGNPKVRIIVRPLPWLDQDSAGMAALVAAAARQGKGQSLHEVLMTTEEPYNLSNAQRMAEGLGIDMVKAGKDQTSPEILREISQNLEYAQSLGLSSVPGLLIGNVLYVPTADALPDAAAIRSAIDQHMPAP